MGLVGAASVRRTSEEQHGPLQKAGVLQLV
jgi:hypothetical protein